MHLYYFSRMTLKMKFALPHHTRFFAKEDAYFSTLYVNQREKPINMRYLLVNTAVEHYVSNKNRNYL